MELWVQFTLVGLLSDVASGHWATVIYARIKNVGKVSVEKSILHMIQAMANGSRSRRQSIPHVRASVKGPPHFGHSVSALLFFLP